jgi:queuine tRNA-ribosyltransferase
MASPIRFQLHHTDAACAARCATLYTPHGAVETPAFMPVGTAATVKGLTVDMLRATGAQMILGNVYHLALRPGIPVVQALGGLHRFMGYDGSILTDSGGFQVFSLARINRVTDEGVSFRSHIDGAPLFLSPEGVVQIQEALGSDIAMVLDHVVALPNRPEVIADAVQRTVRWAQRSRQAQQRADQALFGIVQGGLDVQLRQQCTHDLLRIGFDGYAIGGLSVGESPDDMYRILQHTVGQLPVQQPRYLMGVGRPEDLLYAIGQGVDLFDCVLPTRNGRNAMAFTDQGPLRLRNACYQLDQRPLEPDCPCPACRHSRAYLRHLFVAGEMLGPILLTAHNLTYYQRLMRAARDAIRRDAFTRFAADHRARWQGTAEEPMHSRPVP